LDLITDRQTGRSKGFAFVYYESISQATKAKEHCNDMVIDGRKIRTDYSLTLGPHDATPGKGGGGSGSGGGGGGGGRRSSPRRGGYDSRDVRYDRYDNRDDYRH